MKYTVWKYEVPINFDFTLELPIGAKILKYDTQRNVPMLWVLVNSANDKEKRKFIMLGTGHERELSPISLIYIGTCLMMGDGLVWHLFEVIEV